MSEKSIIDLNNVGCIKEITEFGYYKMHNICTDSVSDVAWGFGDWVAFAAITIMVLVLAALIGVIIRALMNGDL